VDDILAIAPNGSTIKSFQEQLARVVKLSLFEPVANYLGIRVITARHKTTLDQEAYLAEVLKKCNMSDSKPAPTPATQEELVECPPGAELNSTDKKYVQFVVGASLHAYVCTLPEIGYALNQLGKYVARPGPQHLQAAKHLLRYFQGAKSRQLVFKRPMDIRLMNRIFMLSDANWGGTHPDRRSVGGGGCYFNGALAFWQCKRQPAITLSSAESEYTQASLMACMALYVRNIAADIGIPQTSSTPLMEDNQAAIKLATNSTSSIRTRHIDIKYHHLKQEVKNGTIKMVYLPTDNQLADIFTKSLGRVLFVRFRDLIKGHESFDAILVETCFKSTHSTASAALLTILVITP
jgi:hypothetical protein